jgi:hypothetical protein
MPTRRTSPRRTAIRPSGLPERLPSHLDDEPDEPGRLAGAAPWLAIAALVLAAGAIGFLIVRPAGGDLTACRAAAWAAIPSKDDIPADWTLGSTDLSANGMTISVLGPAPADGSTDQPVVVASVTCYGDAAVTALAENRKAAKAVDATVEDRSTADAYDVINPNTGSTTTFFRVGGLIGQVADSGTVPPGDRDAVTVALATAMGDAEAAGAGPHPSDAAVASDEPLGSDSGLEPSSSPFAPELEAVLPKSIVDRASTTSPPPTIPLTVVSNSATDIFGQDPSSRALAARIRALGGTLDQLQIAQAYDDTGAIDLSVIAFRLPKADLAKLRSAIIDTWLSAGAEGVKSSTISLGGKSLTKIDYGDGATIEYVYAKDDYVIVMDTKDLDIATQVAEQLK